jgi:HEAT repeat protein
MFGLACGVALVLGAGEVPVAAQAFFPQRQPQEQTAAGEHPPPPPWEERGLRAALAAASPEVRSQAVQFIADKHWSAIFLTLKDLRPMLHEQLLHDWVLEALAQLGPKAAPCAGEILPLLHDESSSIRQKAVEALGQMGSAAAPHAKDIVPLLRDADSGVRDAAVRALGSLGHAAPAVVSPLLQPLLADTLSAAERDAAKNPPKGADPFGAPTPESDRIFENSRLRCSAVQALGLMGSEGAPLAAPLLQPLLQDADAAVQSEARRALASLKVAPPAGGEKESPDPSLLVASSIAEILKQTGTGTAAAPALTRALLFYLDDPDPATRAAATAALVKAGLKTPVQIVRALAPLLKDPDKEVQLHTSEALQQMGESAAPCVPELLPLLQDGDPEVQISTMRALTKVGDAAAPVVAQALLPLLKSADYRVQTVAVNTLGWMGPATAPVALPALLPLLQGEDSGVRDRIVIALGNMGAAAAPAVKALLPLLKDPDPQVRYPAAEALGQMGAAVAPVAVPALRAALSAEDSMLNYHIQLALDHLEQDAAPQTVATAISRLQQAGDDAKSRLSSVMDPLGNFTHDPAWQCATLAAAARLPAIEAQDLRFHLYLWSGHDPALLLSVRWLGHPAAAPMPANGKALTTAEQQAVLGMLLSLWPHSASYPALRQEMAGRIAQVAQSITVVPDAAVTALLKKLGAELKADAVADSQAASTKAREAVERALARKKAA